MVTKEKCLTGYYIDKRMEQMNNKKNSTSTHIDERSATTGQVVGHDKNGRSSDQENIALTVIGAEMAFVQMGYREKTMHMLRLPRQGLVPWKILRIMLV